MNAQASRIDVQRRESGGLRGSLGRPSRRLGAGLALAALLLASCHAHTSQVGTARTVARLRGTASETRSLAAATLLRDRAGMLFALLPEPASNLVRVDVRYRSGAAADPENKSGLAHLVEHLTYHLRDSPDAPTLASRLGRDALAFNAYTSWDETHYYAIALASHLDSLLAVESDRLRWDCDKLSEAALANERLVVERELELKLPSTPMMDQLRQAAFASGHPYHRGVGGQPGHIGALSLGDVCQFMRDQYRPDNAIMVVSGQIDVAAVQAALEARHGALSPLEASVPGPAAPGPRRGNDPQTVRGDVSSPALVVLVDAPRWGSPESVRHVLGLSVLAERLAERVQADDKVVATSQIHLGGWNDGADGIVVQVTDEAGLEHAARLVSDLRTDPLFGLGDDAFVAARARFQARLLRAHDGFQARALAIADALQYGNVGGIDGILAAAGSVGRGEIEARIRETFARMRTIRVLPADGEAEAAPVSLAADSFSASVPGDPVGGGDPGEDTLPWVAMVDEREAEQDLVLPPLPGYPPIASEQLANGLRVVLVQRTGYPMVYARMSFAGGQGAEPAGRRGLSELAALLRRPGMSAPWSPGLADDLARLASLPVEIDAAVEPAATVFSGSSPSAHAAALLWSMHLHVRYGGYVDLSNIGKVLWRKRLDAIAEQRRTSVEGILQAVVEGDASGEREFEALKATVGSLQEQVLSDHAAREYRPDNGTLIVVGAFDPQHMMATIEELFGDWRSRPAGALQSAPATEPRALAATRGQHVLVADESRKQVRVIVAYPGALDDDDRAAALVLRAILETRLSRELREAMAATYHVSVSFQGNALVIDTELGGPQASRALARVQAIVNGLADEDGDGQFRTDFIVARRKSVEQALASSMSAATLIERASRVSHEGGAVDPLDRLAHEIARLRPADVAALVEQRMPPARANLIIVASKEHGLSLFNAVGIQTPRIVE
jgi:zinc protease